MTAPTCAYPRCQAGGVILEGAPRFERVGLVTGVQLSSYHHGCWAAYQRERQQLDMALEVTAR